MLVVEKYRCQREVGWSDEAEVHAGPPDDAHRVPIAVKIRHGLPGPPRPDGRRDRFLRAANDQQAAVLAGCSSVAPVFETGQEGNNAYYVSRHYPRSVDSLIQGRVALEPAALHRLTDRILRTLEDLRDKHGRAHGNLKPTNIFLDGKGVASATIVLGDLSIREEGTNQGTDCYGLGAVLYQLIRGRSVRNFDWPMVHGPDWDKLGPAADGWREFCNVLMSPETSANPDALGSARQAFKNMRRLAAAGRRRVTTGAAAAAETERIRTAGSPAKRGLLAGLGAALVAGVSAVVLAVQPADSKAKAYLRTLPVPRDVCRPTLSAAYADPDRRSRPGPGTRAGRLAAHRGDAGHGNARADRLAHASADPDPRAHRHARPDADLHRLRRPAGPLQGSDQRPRDGRSPRKSHPLFDGPEVGHPRLHGPDRRSQVAGVPEEAPGPDSQHRQRARSAR